MQTKEKFTLIFFMTLVLDLMFIQGVGSEELRERDYIGKNVDEFIMNGARLYNNGNLDGALLEFKKATYADSKSTAAAYFLGMAYEKKGMPKDAFTAYSRGLKTQPQGYVIPEFGNCASLIDEKIKNLLKNNSLKEQLMNEYVKQVPWGQSGLEEANKLFKEGWVLHRELGLYDESIQTYLQAIMIDPKFADAYKEIGLVYMKEADYATAKVFLEKALKIQPNHSLALHDLAICKGELGASSEEVAESYQKALMAAPDNIFPLYALGRDNISDGHYEEGIALLEKAISQNPEYKNSYEPLLEAYLKTGRYDDAIITAQKALVLFPEDIDIRMMLAKGYKNKKIYDKAIEEYNKILESNAHGLDPYIGLAGVYVAQGEMGKAVTILEENSSPYFNNKKACVSYGLGKIYMDEGKYKDAASEFEDMLKLEPDYLDAITNLQILYAQYLDNPDKAAYFENEYKRLTAKYEEEKPWLVVNKGGISGLVTKADGITPIAGINIDVLGPKGGGWSTTDLDGRYIVRSLPEGAYTVEANSRGYEEFENSRTDNITVSKDAITENINFKLRKFGSILGRVLSSKGDGIPDIEIGADDLSMVKTPPDTTDTEFAVEMLQRHGMATSDKNGYYMIKKLLPGTYVVNAYGEQYFEMVMDVTVKEGEETKSVNVTASKDDTMNQMMKLLFQNKQ